MKKVRKMNWVNSLIFTLFIFIGVIIPFIPALILAYPNYSNYPEKPIEIFIFIISFIIAAFGGLFFPVLYYKKIHKIKNWKDAIRMASLRD